MKSIKRTSNDAINAAFVYAKDQDTQVLKERAQQRRK